MFGYWAQCWNSIVRIPIRETTCTRYPVGYLLLLGHNTTCGTIIYDNSPFSEYNASDFWCFKMCQTTLQTTSETQQTHYLKLLYFQTQLLLLLLYLYIKPYYPKP